MAKKPKKRSITLTLTMRQEAKALRSFLRYLRQPATKSALLSRAQDDGRLTEFMGYLGVLKTHIPSDSTDEALLQGAVKVAPALEAVVALSFSLSRSVIPPGNRVSNAFLLDVLKAYHTWVQQ